MHLKNQLLDRCSSDGFGLFRRYPVLLLAVTFVAMPVSIFAQSLTWNGSVDDDWFEANNWTPDSGPNIVPTNTTPVLVGNGTAAPIVINSTSTAEAASIFYQGNTSNASLDILSDLNVAGDVQLSFHASGQATQSNSSLVNIGGNLTIRSRNANTESYWILNDNSQLDIAGQMLVTTVGTSPRGSYVIQNGSSQVTVGNYMNIESDASINGGYGYTMNSGMLTVNNTPGGSGSTPDGLGVGYNGPGGFQHLGGTVDINNGNLEIGSRTNSINSSPEGVFYFSSETAILDVQGDVVLGTTNSDGTAGTGTFILSGNGAGSVNVDGWEQTELNAAGVGILTLQISTDGLLTIDVDGDVYLGAGSILMIEEIDGYIAAIDDQYTFMNYTGTLTDGGLDLDTFGWEYSVVDNGSFDSLVVTYTGVPEPAASSLLLCALGVTLLRRRPGL